MRFRRRRSDRPLVENLLRNAVDHGGRDVTVTVGDIESGFFLEDEGPGIPPGNRDRVFEFGYASTDDGIGFGLGIVDRIVEAHGWSIRIADTNRGARFEISGVDAAQ